MRIKRFIWLKWPPKVQTISFKKLIARSGLYFALGLSVTTPVSFAADFADHEIKAVFLFNFATFIRWPEGAFESDTAPFVVCTSNPSSPLTLSLASVIQGESLNKHPLVLGTPQDVLESTSCHVLFLEAADVSLYTELLSGESDTTVLTVSDVKGFARQGGMIELSRDNSHIKPVINLQRLEQSNLAASSTLLRLSKIYRASTDDSRGNP